MRDEREQVASAFRENALDEHPDFFRYRDFDGTLLYNYRKGWRVVTPLSERHAKIRGFNRCVALGYGLIAGKRCHIPVLPSDEAMLCGEVPIVLRDNDKEKRD